MVQLLCTDDMKKQLLLEGGGFARIYAPDGQMMHAPLAENEEGLVLADLDLGMISLAKAAPDPAGHYARPDVTRLMLNKTPGDRVVAFSLPGTDAAHGDGSEPGAPLRAVAPDGTTPQLTRAA